MISLAAIVAVLIIVVIVVSRDLILRRSQEFQCGDGPRRTIDIRDFTTKYLGYSVEFGGECPRQSKGFDESDSGTITAVDRGIAEHAGIPQICCRRIQLLRNNEGAIQRVRSLVSSSRRDG